MRKLILLGICAGTLTDLRGAERTALWDGSMSELWSQSANWTPSGVPNNGADSYSVVIDLPGAAVLVDDLFAIRNLTLADSELRIDLPGSLTIEETFTWNDASVRGSGTLTINGALNFTGFKGVTHRLFADASGLQLINNGVATLNDSDLQIGAFLPAAPAAQFINAGEFRATGHGDIEFTLGRNPVFRNETTGLFVKFGAGTTTTVSTMLDSAGIVAVSDGTLALAGGASFTGGELLVEAPGTVSFTGARDYEFGAGFRSLGNVNFESGSVSTFTKRAQFLGGAVNVRSGAAVTIDGLDGPLLNRPIILGSDAAFTNAGTVNVTRGSLDLRGGSSSSGSFTVGSLGALSFDAGTHTLGSASSITGAGRVDIFDDTTLNGSYNVSGKTRVDSVRTLFIGDAPVFGDLEILGGILAISPTTTPAESFASTLTWTEGRLAGSHRLIVSGATVISGAEVKEVGGGGGRATQLDLRGTTTLSGGNLLLATGGSAGVSSSIENRGTFNAIGEADILVLDLGEGIPFFANFAGSVFNHSGAGTTTINPRFQVSNAAVNVNAGTLDLAGGVEDIGFSEFTVAEGAVLALGGSTVFRGSSNVTGAGSVRFAGSAATVGGGYNVSGLTQIASGTVTFTGGRGVGSVSLAAGATLIDDVDLSVPGHFQWDGGVITGSGTLTTAGGLTLTSPTVKTLLRNDVTFFSTTTRAGRLVTEGVTSLSGGNLEVAMDDDDQNYLDNAIVNRGAFNITDGADITLRQAFRFGNDSPDYSTLSNRNGFQINAEATLTKSGAATHSTIELSTVNSGLIGVSSGTLAFSNDITNLGTVNVSAGATLSLPGSTFNLGTITGEGDVLISSGAFHATDLEANMAAGTYNVMGKTQVVSRLVRFQFGSSAFFGSLVLDDARLLGGAPLNVASGLTWSNSFIGAGGTLTIAGVSTIEGASGNTLGRRAVVNNGSVTMSGDGLAFDTVGTGPGGILNNGTFAVAGFAGIETGDSEFFFTNASGAVLDKSGDGTTSVLGVRFTNAGIVNVRSGRLALVNISGSMTGGLFNVDAGAELAFPNVGFFTSGNHTTTFQGLGAIDVDGKTLSISAGGGFVFNRPDTTLNGVLLDGGFLGGSGNLTLTEPLEWTQGVLGGSGTATGGVRFGGDRRVTLGDGGGERILNQTGSTTLTVGTLFISTATGTGRGSHYRNLGTFLVNGDADIFTNDLGGESGRFSTVTGAIFTKSGAGTGTLVSTAFVNDGTVEVQSGILQLLGGGGGVASSGGYAVESDLRFSGGAFAITGGVSGAGTVTFNGADVAFTGASYSAGQTRISAGSVIYTGGTPVIADLTLTGGFLGGTAPLSLPGFPLWSGGTLGGASTATANSLTITGPATKQLGTGGNAGRSLINTGTATLSGGNLAIATSGGTAAGSRFTNQGTFNATDDADITTLALGGSGASFQPAFVNTSTGIFNKTGADTETMIDVPFTNQGAIAVGSGALALRANSSINGTVAISEDAVVRLFGTGFTLSSTALIPYSGAGELFIEAPVSHTAGALNVDLPNEPLTVRFDTVGVSGPTGVALNLNSGLATIDVATLAGNAVLGGDTPVTVMSGFTWTGGTLRGNSTTVIAPGATLQIGGNGPGNAKLLGDGTSRRTLINQGFANLSNAAITGGLSNTFRITNAASFNSQLINEGRFSVADDSPIEGSGTFTNAAAGTLLKFGAGTLTTIDPKFQNSGLVDVQSGTLQLRSDGGGSTGGQWIVAAGAALSFGLNSSVNLPSPRFDFDATSSISGAGSFLSVGSGSTLNISGAFSVRSLGLTGPSTVNFLGGAPSSIANVTLAAGALGGDRELHVTGALSWSGGAMRGTGTTIVDPGGTLLISGAATPFKTLGSTGELRTLINQGTGAFTGGSAISISSGSQFINQAGFSIRDGSSINGNGTFSNALGATFTKSGAGATTVVSSVFTNAGIVVVQGGALQINRNGSSAGGQWTIAGGSALTFNLNSNVSLPPQIFDFDPASSISGAGSFSSVGNGSTINIGGAYSVTGPASVSGGGAVNFLNGDATTIPNLTLANGTLRTERELHISSNLTWAGGSTSGLIGGSGTLIIDPGTTLQIGGIGTKRLSLGATSRTLINRGTTILSNSAVTSGFSQNQFSLEGSNASVRAEFLNQGQFSILDGSPINGANGVFTNTVAGTFRKSGVGTTSSIAGTLTNAGLVEVVSGSLNMQKSYLQTGGSTRLAGGGLAVPTGFQLNGGVFEGAGTLTGNITVNGGAISPGFSPGVLEVSGNLLATSGALHMEIGGLTSGVDFDQLRVSGSLNLSGATITLAFIDQFAPRTGEAFALFHAGGAFTTGAAFLVSGLEPGWNFSQEFNATTRDFTITSLNDGVAIVPEPGTFALLTATGGMLLNLRRRRASPAPKPTCIA